MDAAAKYHRVYTILLETYGEPLWRPYLPPVDELVSTILSQSTTDTNRDRAFAALKARYATWEELMRAPTADVVETIRPAGLANQKGPRLQAALRHIDDRCGALNLDFLAEMPPAAAQAWLTEIEGVGPKTAAIVLLFAFNRAAFPVDTHVHRVTQRLGLIGDRISAEKAHPLLAQLGPPATYYAMHLNLIRLGREICQARRPACHRCPLAALCAYHQSHG